MTLAEKVASNVTAGKLNTFWWMDISVPDFDKAKDFYGHMFDWTFDDMDPDFHYANAYRGGNRVAGFSDYVQPGKPISWTGYILVDDCVAISAKAKELGAQVIVGGMQVGDQGMMGILVDPQGATFGLWQAGEHKGSELINTEGSLTWTELRSANPEEAIPFYEQLFGWTAEKMDWEGMNYWTFEVDGHVHAGLNKVEGASNHWGVTVGVENTDKAIEWTKSQGGKLTFGPVDSSFGRAAGIVDPFGAALNLMQPPADGWDK